MLRIFRDFLIRLGDSMNLSSIGQNKIIKNINLLNYMVLLFNFVSFVLKSYNWDGQITFYANLFLINVQLKLLL